ncbi:hypothetical protein Efla_002846 [Eimeria flavescens]
MALPALKANIVLRLRACAAADGAFYAACLHTLQLEQERWLNFLENSHRTMAFELAEGQLLQRPAGVRGLTVPEMLSRASHLFGLTAAASQSLEMAKRKHLDLFQQYVFLENSINEVSLEASTSFLCNLRANKPSTTAAAPEAAVGEAAAAAAALERLTQLQSLVEVKELDQQLNDLRRWQGLLHPQKPFFFPEPLFVVEVLPQQQQKQQQDKELQHEQYEEQQQNKLEGQQQRQGEEQQHHQDEEQQQQQAEEKHRQDAEQQQYQCKEQLPLQNEVHQEHLHQQAESEVQQQKHSAETSRPPQLQQWFTQQQHRAKLKQNFQQLPFHVVPHNDTSSSLPDLSTMF